MAGETMKNGARIALQTAALACLVGAAACAPFGSHTRNSPEWFKARIKDSEHKPFPKLASVPPNPPPPRPASHWSAVASDVNQAASDLNASPRSAPADQTPATAEAFETQARKEVNDDRNTPPQ